MRLPAGGAARGAWILLWSLWAAPFMQPLVARAATSWVMLDPDMQREGDRTSLQREGPWVQFTQRWRAPEPRATGRRARVERMAVNCLTGAYGQTRYPATDPQTHKPVQKAQTFAEIEHAQSFDGRLVLDDNATALGQSLKDFACGCDSAESGPAPTAAEIHSTYERYIAEPLSQVEYHLHFLRVQSRQSAQAAIARLAAGAPFGEVFDAYASAGDAVSFPHGDMGAHRESEFPIEDARRLRALHDGDVSPAPHHGLYGWEIVRLDSRRTVPAPALTEMQPRVQRYLVQAHRCGWGP